MNKYIFRCDLAKQYEQYSGEIENAAIKVLRSGVYTLGKEVELFEKAFAKYTGRSYGVAVASGTDALVLALKSSGISQGDEVLTSTYAPAPVATAIVLAGGIPKFVDIDLDTLLIDPEEIIRKVSSRTRFIIPVHLFGNICNMLAINAIAKKYRLVVIEDAAQAHGSLLGRKKAGTFSLLSCFSFYPTKNLGAYGDGGIILTDNNRIAKNLRLLRNYGKKYNPFDSEIVGLNSRMDELQAAILRVKLRYLDRMNKKRISLFKLYKKGLKAAPLAFIKTGENAISNCHILTVLCSYRRESLRDFLESSGIQTNIYYPKALHQMNAFRKYVEKDEQFPASEMATRQALALPLYPELSRKDVCFIIAKIRDFFGCPRM